MARRRNLRKMYDTLDQYRTLIDHTNPYTIERYDELLELFLSSLTDVDEAPLIVYKDGVVYAGQDLRVSRETEYDY